MVRFANLSRNVQEEHLREICGNYGHVKHIEFINFERTFKPKGVAYVTFEKEEDAKKILECFAPTESQLEDDKDKY